MGQESNERGAGLAVAVVIVVLLCFFILFCVGSGLAVFLFGVRSPGPIAGPRAVQSSSMMPTTIPAPAYTDGVADSDQTVTTPVQIAADGTIRIAGELVPLEELELHLGRLAERSGGQAYLFLDVKVAPDCPAAPLVKLLNRIRQRGSCDVELSLADPP